MIIVLQVAGVLAILIGLATIGVGIPVKEFSFGNTLILAGTVGVCTGMILLGLSVVARELRLLTRRLAASRPGAEPRPRMALPAFPGAQAAGDAGPPFSREQPVPPPMPPQGEPSMAPPWRDDPSSRAGPDAPLEAEPEGGGPAQSPRRRNLMFSSTVRKDRDGWSARPGDPAAAEPGEAPPASFGDAWPKPDRARSAELPSQRRASWPAPGEPADDSTRERQAAPMSPPAPGGPAAAVTVLKSGIVEGMSYSLYSDGSIEAQMPEGMMRFGSIDELRAHLDQRS